MKAKNVISAMTGILLCISYLAGVTGYDIHIDHHNGRTFVVSLLQHTDCENIHPEDHCHCTEHHRGHCHEHDQDCEDQINILDITGDFQTGHIVAPGIYVTELMSAPAQPYPVSSRITPSGECLKDPPRLQLSLLCVLRV